MTQERKYFKQLLAYLGFQNTKNKQIVRKNYEQFGCRIEVNFSEEKIIYPESGGMKLGDLTTSNFAASENFVVLECVNRLLEKGYPPSCIELEKKWSLGRRSKGKLDILVKREDSTAYLMIECKTSGEGFNSEVEHMLNRGGQLFSYWQQDKNADVLCLYSSKYINGNVKYESNIVLIEEKIRKTGSVVEAHGQWNKQFLQKGVFEEDINAYGIEFTPLCRQDLKPLGRRDGNTIYLQFLEILRHNIVSDKGNAFKQNFQSVSL